MSSYFKWWTYIFQVQHENDNQNESKKFYECGACDKVFKTNENRKNHRVVDHPEIERLNVCKICQKGFIYPKHLRDHQKIHQGHK